MAPKRRGYAIYDKQLDALCTLPDGTEPVPNHLPLEWRYPEEAEEWLFRCRRAWRLGEVPPPHRWNSWRPAERSPWEGYTSPDPEGKLRGPAPLFRQSGPGIPVPRFRADES